jgi:bifunctional ADP-heptose synthase (sugar kinase/adenylyltransferase)
MLTDDRVEFILERIPRLTIGVLGDLFLDRYLDIGASLTEKSIETGLDAYQVTRVRSSPGAAGTVINNLVALGVKRVVAVSVIGDDGEGYELRQALERLKVIDTAHVIVSPERRTPTYTKPLLLESGKTPRELNRLDIKNRLPLPGWLEDSVLAALNDVWPRVDALLVMDQVSERDCGVVTGRIRELLVRLGEATPPRFILADSRECIGLYRSVSIKPNERELREACCGAGIFGGLPHGAGLPPVNVSMKDIVTQYAERIRASIFCTMGEMGMMLAEHLPAEIRVTGVAAYPVAGPIDIVGAGDSTSAAIGCAVAAGATQEEAAAFGNLVASITIQQIGTTGTATPQQVRQRWREVR